MEKFEIHTIPQIVKDVGFDFDWDEQKVWGLDIPVSEIATLELVWHFEVPFLGHRGQDYNLTPRAVMEDPGLYPHEYQRTQNANASYPIDIMDNKGRWVILDGLHRLMKLYMRGAKTVRVRVVSPEFIDKIKV